MSHGNRPSEHYGLALFERVCGNSCEASKSTFHRGAVNFQLILAATRFFSSKSLSPAVGQNMLSIKVGDVS